MDPGLAQTLAVGAMLAVFALILDRRDRARHSELKADIDTLRTELRTEIAAVRSEMRFELASIRSDLMQVALAVGVQPRPQTG
jgi:hypothetical protein